MNYFGSITLEQGNLLLAGFTHLLSTGTVSLMRQDPMEWEATAGQPCRNEIVWLANNPIPL